MALWFRTKTSRAIVHRAQPDFVLPVHDRTLFPTPVSTPARGGSEFALLADARNAVLQFMAEADVLATRSLLMSQRRFLLLGIGILILLGALAVFSGRVGFWSFGGDSVQVLDTSAAFLNGQGVLVCTSSRAWGVPDGSKSEVSYMHLLPETTILDQRTSFLPTPARSSDLRPGQNLRVWIQGGALFSYPSQVSAERIVIEDNGQSAALSCQWRGLAP
jgi:hypothetical protein